MSRKVATTLAVLLVFGTASAALPDATNRADYLRLLDQRPVSLMWKARTQAVNDVAEPFTTQKTASLAASEPALARSVPFKSLPPTRATEKSWPHVWPP